MGIPCIIRIYTRETALASLFLHMRIAHIQNPSTVPNRADKIEISAVTPIPSTTSFHLDSRTKVFSKLVPNSFRKLLNVAPLLFFISGTASAIFAL